MLKKALAGVMRRYIRATPPHPGRGLLGKLAWRLDPREIVHEYSPGVKLRLSTRSADHITYWTDAYEEHGELGVFLGMLRPGMVVCDVGANIGMYTAAAARAVGPAGRVFAFEPMPHLFAHLLDTIALNGCGKTVSAHKLALSDRSGPSRFHVGRTDSIGSLVRPSDTSATVDVETTTLDDFLLAQGIERVDAIKIDVEGAEPLVLKGIRDLLSRPGKPILLIEHNYPALEAAGSSAESLFADVLAFGYQARAVVGGQAVPVTALVEPSRRMAEAKMDYLFLPASD